MVLATDTRSASTHHHHDPDRLQVTARQMNRCGFTLIELAVVLLLLSTIAVVATPRWSASLQRLRVSNAANRIVADLARAQSAAYSSSASKTVTFTVRTSQYTVSGVTSLNLGTGPYVVDLTADPFQCSLMSVWGQTGTQTITFDGFGLPNRGGNIIVATTEFQKTVVVDATSGLAVIQ